MSPAHSDLEISAAAPPRANLAESRSPLTLLYSSIVFLGAFLLFLLEPLFAKLILPWFGGSAAVWATCLVFFQSALLLGYLYADLTSRVAPARQALLHIALLVLSLWLLPIAPHASWRTPAGNHVAWQILGLLSASIGLPFALLSATSPLVQTWLARRRAGSSPYHLFALSNFASFTALLSFPFLIEPRLSSHAQANLWSALFVVFAVLCSLGALTAMRSHMNWVSQKFPALPAHPASPEAAVASRPSHRAQFQWLALSACGSMLLLSITNHLTQDVAPVPLLWVLPLALYLMTFTLAFTRRSLYSRWLLVWLLAVALGALGYAIYDSSYTNRIQVSVPLFCAGLFVCCFFCHGELRRLQPPPRFLTSYYLFISLGGALGAIFVGLIAPLIFRNFYELPVALFLTAAVALAVLWPEGWLYRIFWSAACVAMAVVVVLNVRSFQEDTVLMTRSFYGALRVKDYAKATAEEYLSLLHGSIEHGAQYLDASRRFQPTTYYGPDSGVGLALRLCCAGPKRAGVIGLGAGTLAAYGQPGDVFRFYEINPQVVPIAQTFFTYLRETPAKVDIVLGDARLSLEHEPPQQFDVLAVDAFSGDAIPVHLLTREAVALYLRHLKPGGILAIHTSNTYLRLAPIVQLLARDAGCSARLIASDDDEDNLIDSSDWVLVTRNQSFLDNPETSENAEPIDVPPGLRLWTDDHNNLFQILRPVDFSKKKDDQ